MWAEILQFLLFVLMPVESAVFLSPSVSSHSVEYPVLLPALSHSIPSRRKLTDPKLGR